MRLTRVRAPLGVLTVPEYFGRGKRVLACDAFGQGVAGQTTQSRIANPAGSGRVYLLKDFSALTTTGAVFTIALYHATGADLAAYEKDADPVDARWDGDPGPTPLRLSRANNVAEGGDRLFNTNLPAATPVPVPGLQVVLRAGASVQGHTFGLNTDMRLFCYAYEL